jgi:hypothetical protein
VKVIKESYPSMEVTGMDHKYQCGLIPKPEYYEGQLNKSNLLVKV